MVFLCYSVPRTLCSHPWICSLFKLLPIYVGFDFFPTSSIDCLLPVGSTWQMELVELPISWEDPHTCMHWDYFKNSDYFASLSFLWSLSICVQKTLCFQPWICSLFELLPIYIGFHFFLTSLIEGLIAGPFLVCPSLLLFGLLVSLPLVHSTQLCRQPRSPLLHSHTHFSIGLCLLIS